MDEKKGFSHEQELAQNPFSALRLHVSEQRKTNCWPSLWVRLKISQYFNKETTKTVSVKCWCSTADTTHSLKAKPNDFLTDWLKLAHRIRAESSDVLQKLHTARCFLVLPLSSVPPSPPLQKQECFSLWLLHHLYFLHRDNEVLINTNTLLIL